MKERTCKQILIDWLAANPGFHNKVKLTAMTWLYDKSKFKSFAADTVAPKLREAERKGLIQKREENGQTWYAALDTPVLPKIRYEAIIKDGVRVVRQVTEIP